jgi:hypothetical protein
MIMPIKVTMLPASANWWCSDRDLNQLRRSLPAAGYSVAEILSDEINQPPSWPDQPWLFLPLRFWSEFLAVRDH